MVRNVWFAGRRIAITVASMGGLALASCTSGVGGIVVERDGAGGARDGSSDAREAGGSSTGGAGGAAGASSDGAPGDVRDVSMERADDGATPPICVFHTDPPSMLTQPGDGGADGTSTDAGGTDAAETGSGDAGSDASSADVTVVDASDPDATGVDGSTADVSSTDASSDAAGDRTARDGAGEAGDGAVAPSITILTSPFLGPYLADSTGRTLYTFGNDQPGDCSYPPVPDCEADCAIAWPPFDAGKRTLAMGLDPGVFGSVARADGVSQVTTYFGWPLYYYRSDPTGGVINGHGKSKTWHVATVIPPTIMIMRTKTAPRYIADGTGHTLYVYDQDTAGTATSSPMSACTGSCIAQYPPFVSNRINAVSSLDPNDLSLFVRPDMGGQQVAYKGAPLYFSAADMRSGHQNGVSMGWTLAAAP